MNQNIIKELKEKLEKEKLSLEQELKKFAAKDDKPKGDWDTKFPNWDSNAAGGSAMETEADEVEEYERRLPVEHSLELKLTDINSALEKIGKNKYGLCEKCGKKIEEARLETIPEARFCQSC
ncbi:MAG: TraR/DksA C4-type zinc finger protein, partial [bacterium]